MTAGHAGTTKNPHNYFISHFHTLGKFSFLDSLSALKNPVFVLKIFKILKIHISVINIWKLWPSVWCLGPIDERATHDSSKFSATQSHENQIAWRSNFNCKKIVPSKSKKILSILQNYMIFLHYKWIIRHLFIFYHENKSNFMIISEKLSTCHLRVNFRLITAPS